MRLFLLGPPAAGGPRRWLCVGAITGARICDGEVAASAAGRGASTRRGDYLPLLAVSMRIKLWQVRVLITCIGRGKEQCHFGTNVRQAGKGEL